MTKAEPCSRCTHPTTRRTGYGTVICASCAQPPKAKPLATPQPGSLTMTQVAAKFRDVPGQGMLSLDDAEPGVIEYGPGAEQG